MRSKIKNKSLMKAAKILIIILLISILTLPAASCKLADIIGKIGIVRGSGNVISEDRDISSFSKISISGSGNLIIEQGSTESLTIEAEDNIIPLIITEIKGDTLNIGPKRGTNIITTKKINYYLSLKDLTVIEKSGSIDIICQSLDTDNLTIDKSGSGSIEFASLTAGELKISSSGSGNFIFTGVVETLEINMSGSGDYDGAGLVSENCTIDTSGSAEVTVNVSGNLNIKTSGSGDVNYIGNPIINSSVSGSSNVTNISE